MIATLTDPRTDLCDVAAAPARRTKTRRHQLRFWNRRVA